MKDKKNTVLAVATQLFAENGFDNTSVAHICHKANVSKGLVYHHFKSKDEILIEIFSQTTERMIEMNATPNNKPPQQQLIDLIEALFNQLENDKLFFQLNLNIMFQPSTKTLLKSQLKERSSLLLESVQHIFNKIDQAKGSVLSFMFLAELDGVALDYLSVYENYPIEEIKEHLMNKYKNL